MSAETSARSVRQAEGLDPVRALQRVLYRSAKQDHERRFHALYGHVARSDVLWQAWVDVATNNGAPGIDGVSIAQIEAEGVAGVRAFLDDLAVTLKAGTYRPKALRRVYIPKAGDPAGKASRPLSIPAVVDRVVMTATKIVLEPVFEADFLPTSFGFRPKRSTLQALEAVRQAANRGLVWVLDADIKSCFDEIGHDALVGLVERRVSDRRMLKLLRGWLRAGIFEGGVVSKVEAGTPQGSPLSPLLCNVALHLLDQEWAKGASGLGELVKYADDFVVLCSSRARAEAARERAAAALAPLGLRLHPEKTQVVCLSRGEQGFDFLGFHHRMVESLKWRGRWYLNKWPSNRAMTRIRAKVRERTPRRYASLEVRTVAEQLNPVLRGWGNYYRWGNSNRKFQQVDSYVHERLAMLASIKYKMPRRRNWASRFDVTWLHRQGVYRLTGTVRQWPAHA
jgi:group II intron reverse transcriptase/maturase